jgi:hypothetical protein
MIILRRFQSSPDDVKFGRWCLDTLLRLLLEGMEGADRSGQLHCVDGPIRIALMVRHNLQNAGSAKALQNLRIYVRSAYLSLEKSKADRLADLGGKRLQSLWEDPIQKSGFG